MQALRVIGNVLWFILAGFWLALAYAIAGIVAFILIITIPFGVQAFKMAGYALWPFGRVVVEDPDASDGLSMVGNVIWFVFAGWWLALVHVVSGVLLFASIIGIPFGVAVFKMAWLALAPFGRQVVDEMDVLAATATPAVRVRTLGRAESPAPFVPSVAANESSQTIRENKIESNRGALGR